MKKLILVFVTILAFSFCENGELTEDNTLEATLQNEDVFSKKGNNSGKKSNKVAVYHNNKVTIDHHRLGIKVFGYTTTLSFPCLLTEATPKRKLSIMIFFKVTFVSLPTHFEYSHCGDVVSLQ